MKDVAEHHERVSVYVKSLAESLGVNSIAAELCFEAAKVHDIGKLGIPREILLKPGKLTAHEYELIKLHPIIGEKMLYTEDKAAAKIVRHHHERWDGKGYPDGLSGEEIPLASRIIAVADAYDAMTAKRVYQDTKTRDEALNEITNCAGSQFDPLLAYVFAEMIKKISDFNSVIC